MQDEFNPAALWGAAKVKQLSRIPKPKDIDKHQNRDYIPIDRLQRRMDELFPMMWTEKHIQTQIVANEFIVTIELSVYNPVLREWITRVGVGAAMIQQEAGAVVTDVSKKIKNTLQKDAPAARARAFANAAKGFGNLLGRNLQRKEDKRANDPLDFSLAIVTPSDVPAIPVALPVPSILDELQRAINLVDTDKNAAKELATNLYNDNSYQFAESAELRGKLQEFKERFKATAPLPTIHNL